MIKILQIFGEPLSNGGQEAFIMNMYNNIDKNIIQFDFFTPYFCDNIKMKKEIEKMKGKVFVGNGTFKRLKRKQEFSKKLNIFLKNNKYDIVHIHSGSIFSLAKGAKIAKKSGVKKVIVHSHATGFKSLKHLFVKILFSNTFIKYSDYYFSCSDEAAEFKFPKKIIKEKKYDVIKNGIDLENFSFSEEIRNKYRKKLNIENDFVICHVGRFSKEKNHLFLIEIFKEIKKKNTNSKLILIGDGPLKSAIYDIVNKCNLNKDVLFLGIRKDISEIMQASDVLVFPSIYEGLGIVTIEAQAVGLPVFASENIPKDANITNYFELELSKGAGYWANKIVIDSKNTKRKKTKDIKSKIIKSGYDIKSSSKELQDKYLKIKEQEESDNI